MRFNPCTSTGDWEVDILITFYFDLVSARPPARDKDLGLCFDDRYTCIIAILCMPRAAHVNNLRSPVYANGRCDSKLVFLSLFVN